MQRPLTFFSAFLLSSAIAYAQNAATRPFPRGSAPAWGTENASIYTIFPWEFEPLTDQMSFSNTSPGTFLRYCVSSVAPYDPTGYLEAAVHLPSGALIDFIQLASCDTDPSGDVTAALYYLEDIGVTSTVIGSVSSAGAALGCTIVSSDPIGHTVDNLKSYAVEVGLPAGSTAAALRSVRILYHLQVSPPGGPPTFNDVPASHPFYQFIEALAASGITAGCGGGNFCPNSPLTRGQMAVFLAKALGLYWPY